MNNSNKVAQFVLGDWGANFILTLDTGQPQTINCTKTTGAGTGCYALNTGVDPYSGQHNVQQYYNPAAFAPPALGTNITTPVLGNLGGGSGVLSLPKIVNTDATMSKFIPFHERLGLRLQVQAYNVFNHPQFVGLGTGLVYDAAGNQTSLTAGVFNTTLPARVMAFSVRFEF